MYVIVVVSSALMPTIWAWCVWQASMNFSTGWSTPMFRVTDGLRTVEWWDTYQGRLLHSEKLSAAGGRLVLTVPPLDRDIACKVKG